MNNDAVKKDFIMLEDGFYYFDTPKGAIAAHQLRTIADILDEVNEPWHQSIDNFFK